MSCGSSADGNHHSGRGFRKSSFGGQPAAFFLDGFQPFASRPKCFGSVWGGIQKKIKDGHLDVKQKFQFFWNIPVFGYR